MLDKDKIIQEAKKQLDNLSKEMDKLEEKMKDLSGEAKKVYEEQSAELRSMLQDAERNLGGSERVCRINRQSAPEFLQLLSFAL
jgi:hypothetical protein